MDQPHGAEWIYEYQPTMYHTEVTLEAWRRRPLWERIQERWARALRSQL